MSLMLCNHELNLTYLFFLATAVMSTSTQQQPTVEKNETCTNPGNPVFSCMSKPEVKDAPLTPWAKPQNPLYRTTSNDYGLHPPTFESSPCCFYPKSHKFSKDLAKHGRYEDNSFNTVLDRSKVPRCSNLKRKTLWINVKSELRENLNVKQNGNKKNMQCLHKSLWNLEWAVVDSITAFDSGVTLNSVDVFIDPAL